jgi:hypothetical protein
MDHEIAIRTRAAERYALDEMENEEGLDFEAHFFECEDCAGDVKAATQFRANARAWFAQHRNSELREKSREGSRWKWWWRPVVFSPALTAVFVALAGYSWLVTIPKLRSERAVSERIEAFQPVLLRAQTRGEPLPNVKVVRGSPAILAVSIESDREYSGYEVQVLNPSGATIARTNVPAWPTVTLRLPAAMLGNGTHTVIVRGAEDGRPEIARYQFEVGR